MALDQNYYVLWFESFELEKTSGHKSRIQLRLMNNQHIPSEITDECKLRSVDAFSLLTECSKKLFNNYAVGTKFKLKAKLTDREGGGLYMYSYPGWKPIEIIHKEA